MAANKREIREVRIADIVIPSNRLHVDDDDVMSLMRSIAAHGLHHCPIVNEDYRLIAGRHRIEACTRLGWKTIECEICNLPELQAELVEIDENIERRQFTALEYSIVLRRRKAIYEALNTDAKHGGDRKSEKSSGHSVHLIRPASFAEDTAKATGQSERSIRRAVEIAEKLDDKAAEMIADTPVADNKAELKRLGSLPPAEQRAVAEKIKSGKAATVEQAAKKTKPQVLDSKKRPVPTDLIPAFEAVGEFKAINRELAAILKRVETLSQSPAGAFLEYGSIRTDIENVKSAVKFGTPYIVCTYCKGTGNNCKPCRGSGYLNQSPSTRNEESAK